MSLNLSHLRAFHAAASEGTLTRAAERLHVSQPTLSSQVKELEERHGVQLFERHGRRLSLTPLGRELAGIAGRLFDLRDEAEDLLQGARSLERGQLTLGADSPRLAAQLLARFRAAYPGVQLSLRLGTSREVVRDLHELRCDVALLAEITAMPELQTVPVQSGRLMALLPSWHPWRTHRAVPVRDFASAQLILRPEGSLTRSLFDRMIQETLGPDETIEALEVNTREGVVEAVAAGLGLGVVNEHEATADRRVLARPFDPPGPAMEERIVCLPARARLRVVRAFMALAPPASLRDSGPS